MRPLHPHLAGAIPQCQAERERFQIMLSFTCDHVQQQDELMLQPPARIWDSKTQYTLNGIA